METDFKLLSMDGLLARQVALDKRRRQVLAQWKEKFDEYSVVEDQLTAVTDEIIKRYATE